MQLNLIDYKELTQTACRRSQHNNDKMRKRLLLNVFAQPNLRQFERITYSCMLPIMHRRGVHI